MPRPVGAQVEPEAADCDRDAVVIAWRTGGSQVRAAAERALLGADADICAFLDTDWAQRGRVDDRLSVNQILAAGGPTVRDAARQALDSTDPAALGSFVESGWRQPSLTDQRIRVNQMLAAGGAQLRTAAQRALDAGTATAMETFLDSGWRQPLLTDQRVRINQILASGGPEVRVAAQRALDAGTLEALTRFIDVDWGVAAARDQETQTLTDLVRAAEVAGAKANAETQAAKTEAERAVSEAAAAKQAAQAAAQAAANAQNDAAVAAAESRRAADAADRAAAAAQQAVSAARAASAAARVAADAAARAATAAARTGEAASRAYQSAALAATNAGEAQRARDAAVRARAAAEQTRQVAEAARHAGEAALAAAFAASAASGAADNANASAQAAVEAGDWAARSGADASAARAAAARARANANRATHAAQAAISFANTAAEAAFNARDAANRAVANANAAAAAAEEAAEHAGQAADAAAQATAHANAATQAAEEAVTAAEQAKVVYDAARAADTERITIALEQGDEAALAFAAEISSQHDRAGWDAQQAASRSAETNRLITIAADPATPTADAVPAARKVALALATSDGSWTRTAALDALSGNDARVVEFVRTGIDAAAAQDDRATLAGLLVTGSAAMRAAAQAALDGSDADVAEFLRDRDYPGRDGEDRLAVNQVLAAAREAGDQTTVEYAQQALDDGSDAALRQFLETTQYTAAADDKRIKVNQILAAPDSGSELTASARIALDGPPAFLDQFLTVERYAAAQRDQDAAAHDATVTALLAQAAEVAAGAMQNAMEAQAAAATARNAAAEAAGYAQQAADAAGEAAEYARQAQQSADRAQEAADRAAASARTAADAAHSANASAQRAARSAAWATASAQEASGYAAQAYVSAEHAYHSAVAAGHSAEEANTAASAALAAASRLAGDNMADWADKQAFLCHSPGVDTQACLAQVNEIVQNPGRVAFLNSGVCELFYMRGSDLYNGCLRDVLNPNFELSQKLTFVTAALSDLTAFYTAVASALVTLVAGVVVGAGVAACAICAAVMEFFTPLLAPEMVGLPSAGLVAGSAVSVRTAAVLEELTVETRAQEATFARLISAMKLCGGNSFVPGTPVLLPDGTTKSVQDIRVGDKVLSTEPVTGVTGAQAVTSITTGKGVKRLVAVTVDTDGRAGGATATLTATEAHPFWVAYLGTWVDAADLRTGQWLRTGSGTWVQVARTRHHTERATVHNFTVARNHTYYVAAGAASVLVHNGCSDYQWAPVPAPLDYLPPEELWNPSKGIPVIGRWPEVAVGGSWPGHTYFDLPLPDWSKEKNDAWIQSIINQRGSVYVGSLTVGNYWNKEKDEPSTFVREIQQLLQNGYDWEGDYLVPLP
ncbi:hypothetical protein GCM10012284_57360 [Mangrovihabitans endophyticus]|uniref:Methyl-accepting transducer domain-containing protein n=1 Tax=Mangrovihabitans endophyticus TaxID=1751298 RepID=A0A8J3C7H7_9ACTN|nr:hypothetical protein GCM10012284_57360 [Mangrovihabitans endophyticus]